MQSCHFKSVIEQSRHDWIHFVLGQNQVAHDDIVAAVPFGHGEPATKAKRSRDRIACNLDVQIIPRNVHLQYIRFVVTLLTDNLHDLLIVARNFLRDRHLGESCDADDEHRDNKYFLLYDWVHCVSFFLDVVGVSLVYKTIHLLNALDRRELQRSDRSGHERQQTALPTPEQKGRFANLTESDNARSGHSGRDLSAQKLRGILQP